MKTLSGFLWHIPLLSLLLSLPVQAHNGAVAVAVPVEGITVDGDLSDWPDGLPHYPIALGKELHYKSRDIVDFRAAFQVGYSINENALYLAIKVEDESIIIADSKPSPQNPVLMTDNCQILISLGQNDPSRTMMTLDVRGDSLYGFGPQRILVSSVCDVASVHKANIHLF